MSAGYFDLSVAPLSKEWRRFFYIHLRHLLMRYWAAYYIYECFVNTFFSVSFVHDAFSYFLEVHHRTS